MDRKKNKIFYQYLFLVIKVIFFSWILFPVLFIFYVISKIKARIFLKKKRLLTYLKDHINEIDGLGNSRISNLEVERVRKGISNLLWKQTISFDGGKKITLVGKKFLAFGSIITFLSCRFGPLPNGIPVSIKKRFKQEVDTLKSLRSNGINIPKIIFTDNRQKIILMEDIPGSDFGDLLEEIETAEEVSEYFINLFCNCGRDLAMLHESGVSLVSHNDRSRILKVDDNRIYFVDFELSTSTNYQAWDLAIFMHWIRIKLGFTNKEKIAKIEEAFINGYKRLKEPNQQAINRHLEDLRIYIPFAKVSLWVNRKSKHKPIGKLK